jgi:N-methylhydantoinase B
MAGGSPGACNEFLVHHSDGTVDELDPNSAGTPLLAGDSFQMRLASGGGFGDALDRDAESVAIDVAAGRFSVEDAGDIYGTVLRGDGSVDAAATATRRGDMRRERLARAKPAQRPQGERQAPASKADVFPLYPGVMQQGNLAYAEESGQVLAESPHHWTDGCPVLEERRWPEGAPDVVFRTYLDPLTGSALHVEVALSDGPRSFEVNPRRWTEVA